MRRPELTVDCNNTGHVNNDQSYELTQSPSIRTKRSIDSERSSVNTVDAKFLRNSLDSARPVQAAYTPPEPSILLLFSLLSRRDVLYLIIPAVLSSLIAGGVAPFMTIVVGAVFNTFAGFPLSDPTEADRHALLRGVGLAALELLALAVGAIALGSITSALWISTGERNIMRLRSRVYAAVSMRDMEWFDTKMGAEDAKAVSEGDGPVGAGGLMARFNRDTDDVRMATSLASGMLLQYLTTCIACLVLAFMRSWSLTLVILSALPILTLIQILSQGFAAPLIAAERHHTNVAASLIERAVSAISTVKAFNAQNAEHNALAPSLDAIGSVTYRINAVFGASSAAGQFASMAMFVQGFWFGAHLVRKGSVSAGDVMAVFWACLIAASHLQMCIPQFITLAKGKFAMVALVNLVYPPPEPESNVTVRDSTASNLTFQLPSSQPKSSSLKTRLRSAPKTLRKIQPSRCLGEFSLTDVTFAYPSRPTQPVLRNVSLYFPAKETTFVVGGSGSGKSTIAQLLARLYAPSSGSIHLDEQDVTFLDPAWLRAHVAVVSQSCVLFEGTVHENVAMGVAGLKRDPGEVGREEVVRVCTAALMHEFVRELPMGYETRLGSGGVGLSGGQKQRLAIARAMLRDPTVLVLDEATSALDATSRVLVFEAIKAWRQNKTTIVITHDLSQITAEDFVYVLREGVVVEQGYRADLEEPVPRPFGYNDARSGNEVEGAFRGLMKAQGGTGGFRPRESEDGEGVQEVLEREEILEEEEREREGRRVTVLGLPAAAATVQIQDGGLSAWMLDVVTDLTRSRSVREKVERPLDVRPVDVQALGVKKHRSLGPAMGVGVGVGAKRRSVDTAKKAALGLGMKRNSLRRHLSLQFSPNTPGTTGLRMSMASRGHRRSQAVEEREDGEDDDEEGGVGEGEDGEDEDEIELELEKTALQRMATEAAKRRERRAAVPRTRWTEVKLDNAVVPSPSSENVSESTSLMRLLRDVYPTMPNKPIIAFGLAVCLLSGAVTPIFSFLLSRLLFEVSTGAKDERIINIFGGIVLAVAAADGILIGLKFFIMESTGMAWITQLRKTSFARLLSQDRSFFDQPNNGAPELVQALMKDGDDARNLVAVVLAQGAAVCAMLGVGIVWALVRGWQLTLAGMAIGPVFVVMMGIQAGLVAKAERRNKIAREEIAKGYYECISNIREIRCMSFENVFQEQFEESVARAYATGIRGAFIEGCSFGVANGLIYFAEALLFFIGAVLVAKGTYTYLQMVEVLNLVVFTVTIGAQLMGFTQKIARATQATRDLNKIQSLSMDTEESRGSAMPPVEGDIKFTDVDFSYPERPDVPVLQSTSLRLRKNECVAIVGSSGSGKSTIAALLQRLYEPTSGSVTIGGHDLRAMDVKHLRSHIAVVSQNPYLFDASIAENISYGNAGLSPLDVCRAAQAAHVHDFVMGLPQGYDTPVGANAALISGGQAQRLAIARALARPARVLVLDECTSALDPSSQAAVMETIRSAKVGRTTIVVTHKLPVMQLCDRIVVLAGGRVEEEGTYEQLVRRNGVFAQLARGGEWFSE